MPNSSHPTDPSSRPGQTPPTPPLDLTQAGTGGRTSSKPPHSGSEGGCDRCGAEMFRMHAVWRCPRCGYKTDCCGW